MKRLLVCIALAGLMAALAPAAASATGTTTIDLRGKAVKSLRAQGVKIGAFGGASARPRRVVLRVGGGLVSSTALLNQRGGLVLRRRVEGRRRKVELGRLQVRLGASSEIVGQVGSRRLTLFAVKAPATTLSLDTPNGSGERARSLGVADARGRQADQEAAAAAAAAARRLREADGRRARHRQRRPWTAEVPAAVPAAAPAAATRPCRARSGTSRRCSPAPRERST